MSSEEYWAGRNLEKNSVLQESISKLLNFDSVTSDGSNSTKGDMIGVKGTTKIPVSVKYASGKNTQVHLPTLRSLTRALSIPDNIKDMLDKFLGTNDQQVFTNWSQGITLNADELKYKRINSFHMPEWNLVEKWFNDNRREIAKLLLQSIDNETPAPYLVWAEKKKNCFSIVDVNKLVDYIAESCVWITMPRGTVMRCAIPSTNDKIGKAIIFMQMKNSGGPVDGYNHNPQFHLVKHWPTEFILHEVTNIQFE